MTERIHPIGEASKIVSLSRRTIYREMNEGRFPRPVQLSARRVGWRDTDLQAWLDQRRTA